MMSTFVLPGCPDDRLRLGQRARRPSALLRPGVLAAPLERRSRARLRSGRDGVDGGFAATGSAPAVIATVAGTTSVSKLSSTIFDSARLLAEIEREVAQLPAAGEVAGVGAQRHLGADEGVGEVLAVLEHVLLARAVGELRR